jgi:hypothetical protein
VATLQDSSFEGSGFHFCQELFSLVKSLFGQSLTYGKPATQPLGSNTDFTSGPQEFNFTSASNRKRLGFFPVIPTRDFTNPARPRFHTNQRDGSRMNDLNHLSDPSRRRVEEQNYSIPLLPRGRHVQHSLLKVRHSSTNDQSSTNPSENLREARTSANANHDVSKRQQKTESNAFLLILAQSEYQPPTYLTKTLMPFWIRCAVLGYFRRRDSNTLVRSDQSFESYVNALLQCGYTTETDESIRGIYQALFNFIANQKYMKKNLFYIYMDIIFLFIRDIRLTLSSYPYITIVSFGTQLFRIIENEIRQVYPSMTWFQLDMKKRFGPLATSLYVNSGDEIEQLQVP